MNEPSLIETAAKADSDAAGRERACVAARLGISGDFIRVPQLARALGITGNAIRLQMRRGAFPMPHRQVGCALLVKLDDYIAWMSADLAAAPAFKPPVGAPRPSAPAALAPTRVAERYETARRELAKRSARGRSD